jgi:arylsulfatase A-like enzyme
VIVADDLGYGDLSCMGAPDLLTPHLDELAASGALLTSWYSNSPVCSPARASLLTGRYPGNAGVRSILQGYRTTPGLQPKVPTLASLLHEQHYNTELVGKWHLGLTPASRPSAHGFDKSFGHLAGAVDYFSHIHYSPNNRKVTMEGKTYIGTPLHDLWEDDQEVHHDGEYLTDLVGRRATEAVHRLAKDDNPFFLYVPFNAPHYPMHAPEKYKEPFRHLPPQRMIMAAMIAAMDTAIGHIIGALEQEGVRENTFVLFMSDNGPSREIRNWLDGTQHSYDGGTAGPFKGHKFSLFEGGIRVPGIVSWPARIPAGQTIGEPLAAIDIVPTLLDAIGASTDGLELDGEDILGTLMGRGASPHEYIFWEQGEQSAVRWGPWKLVLRGQLVEEEPAQEEVFLSNLDTDPGETTNLAGTHPEILERLRSALEDWRAGIEQRWATEWLPTIPDHDVHVFPAGVSR